LTPKK